MISKCIVSACLVLFSALLAAEDEPPALPLETVRLQLKWFHSFQFAGYYAAKQQGYYAEEGLDVHILERNPKLNIVKQVVSGDVEYGVEDTGIIADYAKGAPIRALAAIFQHNPLVFIAKQSSGIISPLEMKNKRIMMYGLGADAVGADEAPLRALLVDAGLNRDQYQQIDPSYRYQDLIIDKTDVISAYLTDQPYYFRSKNIKVNIINPSNYGIDIYGDILFTNETELIDHPNRAERFRRASLRGWQYAMDHPDRIIDLLIEHYHAQSSRDHLKFEAEQSRKLIVPDRIALGTLQAKRLRKTADIYTHLNISWHLTDHEIEKFIVKPKNNIILSEQEQRWLKQHPVIRLGIDHNFAPYEWLDENQQYKGITVDYIHLLQRRLGIRFEIVKHKLPWQQLLEAIKQQHLDLVFSIIKTPERSAYINFSEPYFTSPAVIVSGQQQGYIGSLNHLNGKTVAVQRGHSTQELLNYQYPGIEVIATESIYQALLEVEEGKAHAYVGDAISANYVMKKQGIEGLMFSGQTEYTSEFRIGVPKHQLVLHGIIEKALAGISQEEKTEIYNHWREMKQLQGVSYQTLSRYIVAALFIFLLCLYWIVRLRRSKAALQRSEANLQAIFDAEPECIKLISAEGELLQINPAGLELLEARQQPEAILGQSIDGLISTEFRQAYRAMLEKVFKGQTEQLIYQIKSLNGTLRWLEAHTVPLFDPQSGELRMLSVARDITEKRQADEKIWKQANFDSLTHLPNRQLFHEHLDQAVKMSYRHDYTLALLFLDLDHFKEVNDRLGHHIGDLLLMEVAARLLDCVRETDTVARLGGDEFTVVLPQLDARKTVESIAEKIINKLAMPFELQGEQVNISASIGIAIYPDDAREIQDLLTIADQAMYFAKKNGRNRFSYFTQTMQQSALKRMELLKDLHSALPMKQLLLTYQPIINLEKGQIELIEALVCWQHPERGLLKASEFIPIAEKSGLMVEIGNWVIETALVQLHNWQKRLKQDIRMSINISIYQLNDDRSRIKDMSFLSNTAVSGENLVFEMKETMLLEYRDRIKTTLQQIQNAGIKIAIDDFAKGYIALSLLNDFNIEYLKIDRSFTENPNLVIQEKVLTEAIIVMAHKLNLKVIVEGVETEQQQQFLKVTQCDFGQGYWFGKPMSAPDLEKKLLEPKKIG